MDVTPGQLWYTDAGSPCQNSMLVGCGFVSGFGKTGAVNRVVVMIASVGDNPARMSFVSVVICLRTQASRAYLYI